MTGIADDLEEGEIVDEDVQEIVSKNVPRRYASNEHKNVSYKNRRHDPRDASKFASPKSRLKHHRSCFKHKESYKLVCIKSPQSSKFIPGLSKNITSNSHVNSAFKNYSSPPRKVTIKSHSPKKEVISNNPDIEKNNYPQLLQEYRIVRNIKSKNISHYTKRKKSGKMPTPSSNKHAPKSMLPEKSPHINKKDLPNQNNSDKYEESEDEEELRKIALATCVAKSVLESKIVLEKDSLNCLPITESTKEPAQMNLSNARDNYEVVDMEVDENADDENNIEANNDFLFVIDKNPETNGDELNCFSNAIRSNQMQPLRSPSDDDFEEAMLRAQLIASMKFRGERSKNTETENNESEPKELSKEAEATAIVNSCKTLATLKSNNNKKIVKNVKLINAVTPLPNISIPQKRMIISLTNESSSDESESENESSSQKSAMENVAEASIEAFITNARQKAEVIAVDSNTNNVSCLSKAQQEEYFKMKNLLAKNSNTASPSKILVPKSKVENIQRNGLLKRINIARENLRKESVLVGAAKRELTLNKQTYMKSKLKSQHLKQLLADSEKTRLANLQAWNKCDTKLSMLKKSFEKRKEILNLLLMQHESKSTINDKVTNATLDGQNLVPNI